MAFYFCEKCGKRVTDAELAAGQGRDKQLKGVHCAACSDGTMTVAFDAITQADFLKEDQERRQGERHATSTRLSAAKELRRPHRSSNERRTTASTLVVVVVVAVVSAVLGLFFIGRSDPEPSRPSAPKSTAGATTVEPAASSSRQTTTKTAPHPEARPAARQLAEVRAMITADLRDYAQIRQKLDEFSKSFAGTPEAQEAQALRAEVEEKYTRLAEGSLAEILATAKAAASKGAFNDAESKVRSIEIRFGQGAWFESKGKAAVEEALADLAKQREAWALKEVAGTLEKAREELAAGRLEEANQLIANRAQWPAESRTQAEGLAAEIERKLAAADEAKKRAAEGEALLAEFDRLMIAGKYVQARDYAKSKGAAGAGGYGEMLRRGERLAGKMAGGSAAAIAGARTQLGKSVELKLVNGTQKGMLKAVTDAGVTVATTYLINNQEYPRDCDLKWEVLHAAQRQTFARLGGLEIEPSDEAVISVYRRLGSGDMTAARKALDATGEHPLGVHLAEVVRAHEDRMVYASAMELAKGRVEENRWQAAVAECQKALEAKPGDPEAVELLEKARRLASTWTPAEIKPVAWYDAADASTITAKGGAVSQWADKSGNGRHVMQETASLQPVTGSSTIGGLNAIYFEARAGKLLFNSGFNALKGSTNRTMFFVVDAANGNSKYGFFGLGSGRGWGQIWTVSKFHTDLLRRREQYSTPSPNPSTTLLMPALNGSTMRAAEMWANGSPLTGSLLVKGGVNTSADLHVGKTAYGDAAVDSSIGEIVLFNSYLSTVDRQKVEGYLAHKWGLQANLPADHPYKAAAPSASTKGRGATSK